MILTLNVDVYVYFNRFDLMYDFLLFLDLTGDLLALSELEMGGLGGVGFQDDLLC